MTRRSAAAAAAVLPNFVVIGAMRSGSTSLYKYLQAHPDVYMPRKEIHFFDRKWDRGLSWYLTRFEGHSGQTAVGEATPTYLAEPEALDRMASTIPDARLLAVLRDPVDRAYSHYWMEHARARDPRTFEEAIVDELARCPGTSSIGLLGARSLCRASSRTCAHGSRAPSCGWCSSTTCAIAPTRRTPTCAASSAIDDRFVPPRLGERVNRYVEFRSMRLRKVAAASCPRR